MGQIVQREFEDREDRFPYLEKLKINVPVTVIVLLPILNEELELRTVYLLLNEKEKDEDEKRQDEQNQNQNQKKKYINVSFFGNENKMDIIKLYKLSLTKLIEYKNVESKNGDNVRVTFNPFSILKISQWED